MTKALVLGGGGPVGVAWEAGLLAGLADAGVDLTDADRIVGTSAGSIVGARVALGHTPGELVTASESISAGNDAPPAIDPAAFADIGAAIFAAMTGARPVDEVAREIGAKAVAAETTSEEHLVALVSRGLGDPWPERDYVCTAVDVETGVLTAWDAAAGIPLERAVASSCSVPGIFPPVSFGGRHYMDGGIASASNAQLAAGHDAVVVVSVITRVVPGVEEFLRRPLNAEVALLQEGGSAVEVIELDDACAAAGGGNLMDFTLGDAVRAVAREQGRAEAERIGAIWG